jgi:hypothetical protein
MYACDRADDAKNGHRAFPKALVAVRRIRLFFGCSSIVRDRRSMAGPPSGQDAGSVAARHPAGGSTRRRSKVVVSGGPYVVRWPYRIPGTPAGHSASVAEPHGRMSVVPMARASVWGRADPASAARGAQLERHGAAVERHWAAPERQEPPGTSRSCPWNVTELPLEPPAFQLTVGSGREYPGSAAQPPSGSCGVPADGRIGSGACGSAAQPPSGSCGVPADGWTSSESSLRCSRPPYGTLRAPLPVGCPQTATGEPEKWPRTGGRGPRAADGGPAGPIGPRTQPIRRLALA